MALLLAIGGGFLVESLGSYVEYYLLDSRHRDRAAMLRSWWRYLRIAWKVEPTGQHYLRRILAIFKFELNGFVATVAALPGLLWIAASGLVGTRVAALLLLGRGVDLPVPRREPDVTASRADSFAPAARRRRAAVLRGPATFRQHRAPPTRTIGPAA